MPVVLIALAAWFALDALLLCSWLALSARSRRLQVRTMVRAAERYANLTRPRLRESVVRTRPSRVLRQRENVVRTRPSRVLRQRRLGPL